MNTNVQEIVRLANRISKLAAVHAEPKPAKRVSRAKKNGHYNSGNGDGVSIGLKLQGRYMGLTRLMSPRKKAHYRKIRIEDGVRAAIRAIQRDRE